METGMSTNKGLLGLHPTAALSLNMLQVIKSSKQRLAKGSLVSGQSRSLGWSSGE